MDEVSLGVPDVPIPSNVVGIATGIVRDALHMERLPHGHPPGTARHDLFARWRALDATLMTAWQENGEQHFYDDVAGQAHRDCFFRKE